MKYLWYGACFVVTLLICAVVLFNVKGSPKMQLNEDAYKNAAIAVMDMGRGVDTTESLYARYGGVVSETFRASLSELKETLQELDNGKFNIDEYYTTIYEGEEVQYDSSPVVDDVPDDRPDHLKNQNVENTANVSDDSRIHFDGDFAYMYYKDFDFSAGADTVVYKNVYMVVPRDSVPQSYESMKTDPARVYTLKSIQGKETEKGKSKQGEKYTYEAVFVSVTEGTPKKVRLYVDESGALINFEVV